MGIYDKSGNILNLCRAIDGSVPSHAYNLNGDAIWNKDLIILKVANYNVGDWYIGTHTYVPTAKKTEYENLQRTIFGNIDVDVCCMQEAPPKFCQDGTMASVILDDFFEYIETAAAYTSSTIPYRTIGSNIEIEDFESITFPSGASYDTTRSYEKFYITVGGKRICVISSHLALVHSYAVRQAAEMLQAVSGEDYFIIMGDYNTRIYPTDPDYKQTEDYIDMIKPYIDAGCHSANLTHEVFYTYGSTSWEDYMNGDGYICATDHIFTSPNILIDEAYMDTTKRTDLIDEKVDHMPLVAHLIIL